MEMTKEIDNLIQLETNKARIDSLLSTLKRTHHELIFAYNTQEFRDMVNEQERYLENRINELNDEIKKIKFGRD